MLLLVLGRLVSELLLLPDFLPTQLISGLSNRSRLLGFLPYLRSELCNFTAAPKLPLMFTECNGSKISGGRGHQHGPYPVPAELVISGQVVLVLLA